MNLEPTEPSARSAQLFAQVAREIQAHGPLTFAAFMEIVLYQPKLGYYTHGVSPLGPNKDFFTSVSATALFGRLLATVLRTYRDQMGLNTPFCIYEFGAHQGALRNDIQAEAPELQYQSFEYGDALPESMSGVVLSNELLDAMPFHRLKVVGGQWQELVVQLDARSERCSWGLSAVSRPELLTRVAGLPVQLMEGYEVEVCLGAEAWLQTVAERLRSGFVLSIDYGFDTLEYFSPRRVRGGLRCYHRHRVHDDPFNALGEQDITADVNFGALMELGERCGLETVDFTEQGRFLWKRAAPLLRDIIERDAGQLSRDRNAIHLLTHPSMLGAPFKILVQRKRTEHDARPSAEGLK
jgi:SAM-dependent MidA family methyltransferase